MTQPIPDFRSLDPRIDEKLNDILHHCLARDTSRRYATADDLMYDLEYYIYHDGYGPTNETLGKFIRELFGQMPTPAIAPDPNDKTLILAESSRYRRKN